MKTKTVTVTDEYEYALRITLPEPVWSGYEEISTGVYRVAIYIGPRSKRCVVKYDSRWENRLTHCAQGIYYCLITDQGELNRLAGEYAEVGAALEEAGLVTAEEL
jgi:hypothetical protein